MLDFFTHCCLTKFYTLSLELNINFPVREVEIITLIYQFQDIWMSLNELLSIGAKVLFSKQSFFTICQ